MAEKEQEIESVDVSSANIDSNANVDAEVVNQAEAGQATPVSAPPAATKVAAPPKEKPKTMREKTDELFTRVLMGRDKEINNLLNKWGKDKFYKLITTNPKFREDFYKDISGRGISIPVNEYRGYYTPEYEQQKNVVYSDEGVRQIREQEQQRQKEERQKAAEIAQIKNEPWYRALPEALGSATKQAVDVLKQGADIITEAAGKNAVTKSLGIDKFFNYLKDNVTASQRGTAFGEAINETNLPGLATGSTNFDFERIAKQMKDVKSYGATNIELDFQKHEGGWDTVSDYAKMLVPVIIESGSTLMRSGWEETLAASTVGAPEIGGLMAAYHMELFATIVDELEKNHYDVTKGEDWRKAFNNKAFINPILEKANTRAAIITGFDMLGAGLFGNVGGVVARQAKNVAEKIIPKALTSSLGKALSTVGQSKKILSHPTVKAITDKATTVAQQAAKTKGGQAAISGFKGLKEFLNPQEAAAAYAGEATAQLATTGKVNQEESFMEAGGEFGVIKILGRLLKRGGRTFGRAIIGAGTPETVAPAPAGQPPAGGATLPTVSDYEQAVDDAEYEAYQRDKTLHPERRLAVEDDAVKALDDPEFFKKLQDDASKDESSRRYFEMVSDAMEQETKYREAEEVMKAAIAHASELYGGISEKEMADLIDPNSTRYNKDIANVVERKYAELMDAYATETGDESFRQTPAQTPAAAAPTGTTQAVDTQQLPDEVRKRLDAIQRVKEQLASLEASVPQMSPDDLKKYEAIKKSFEKVIAENEQFINKLGYDSKNLTGISSQVGVGQESQQAQPQQGGSAQETGGSGVFQTPGQEIAQEGADEIQAITDEVRALAAQELNPKKLVKNGTLVYKNRKPVYNGQEFKSTKELEAYLQTDEAILAAAESNKAIANALGKTPTFTGTTETGVEQQTTTGEAGPTAQTVAGVQTTEGATETAPVEPTTQKGKGKEVLPEGVSAEKPIHTATDSKGRVSKFFPKRNTKADGLTVTTFEFERSDKGTERITAVNGVPSDVAFADKWQIDNSQIPEGAKVVGVTELRETADGKGAATVIFEADGNKFTKEITLNQKGKPEGKPRVKGDSQEVVEAFEKAVAAGKKISFPVSGGRTTVQLDKPGQLKADEDGGLYIDRGKGKREYLPAGGSEESVIRQQLGVAETAESQKQRKEAVAERNKKAKEQEEQKKKAQEDKQAQQKRDYIARLQKVLDTGKDEKGNPINQRQRKEAEKTIERLKQGIAEAEAAEKLVKGEQPTAEKSETKTEQEKKETEKTSAIPQDIQEAYARRGTLEFTANALRMQMGGKPLVGKAAKELANVESELDAINKKLDAYEKSQQETKQKTKEIATTKGEEKYNREDFPELQSNTRTLVTQKLLDYFADVMGIPKFTEDLSKGNYISWLQNTNATGYEVASKLNAPRQAFDIITNYEKSKQKFDKKPEPVKEQVTELVGSTEAYREYGNYLIDQLVSKDPDGEKSRQRYIDGWNKIAKDKDSGSKANQFLEDILVGMLPADKKATGYADIREAFMKYKPQEKTQEKDAAIQKRIEALDPNESQGYQVDRLRAAKEDMLAQPERAMMAMQAMDFFTEFYGRNDKKYIEYAKKHPLSTVTQYFYNSENSIIDMVREQISGKEFDIIQRREQINQLGKGKKNESLAKTYEQDITDAEKYIQDLKSAYNEFAKENGLEVLLAERKPIPSTIGFDVDAKGQKKNFAYQFSKDEFINKVNESIKSGVFKVDINNFGKTFIATLYNQGGKRLEQVKFERPSEIKGDLTQYASKLLATELHKNSVLLAVTPQQGEVFSQFVKDVSQGKMSAQDAVDIITSAGLKVPDNLKQIAEAQKTEESTVETKETPIGWVQKPVKIKKDVYKFEDKDGVGYIVRTLVGDETTPMWIVSTDEEGTWDGSHNPFKTKEQAERYIESFFKKPTSSQATTKGVAPTEIVEETPEVEQYKPLTSKDIEIGKFSKDEALDYETDEKELDSGRMSEYISSMTVDVMDENGDSIGNLIRLKDEDGITSYQATDLDGNELTLDFFDTKQEAIQAILDAYNKQKGKEFAAEQKRKAKAEEKKTAKAAAKAEKAEPVTPISPEVIESTAESVTDSQMKMIDDIMETERTKPAKAKEMREQFIETHGKEVFDKLNKITRNFEQIISTLEKEGKCTKKC